MQRDAGYAAAVLVRWSTSASGAHARRHRRPRRHLVLLGAGLQRRHLAAGQAAEAIGDVSDQDGIERVHLNVVTRISLPGRALEAYRLIRPFIGQLQEAGYSARLAETELTERNCYREIRNGYGTLQMQEHTEPVLKGRKEVRSLVSEIEAALNEVHQRKAVANG